MTVRSRLLAATVAGLVLALLLPAPAAWAHGAHAPAATNYRSEVTAVTPELPDVRVRTIEAGTGLELTNHSGRPVRVLGYDGEPYLEVGPDGTYENVHSPATYQNRDPSGTTPVPAGADPAAEPSWRRVSGDPVVRWYDRRSSWTSPDPPPQVAADPSTPQQVREWTVPLRYGDTGSTVSGTLTWLPPPTPWPWWGGVLLLAAALGSLGLSGHARPARVAVGGTAVVAGAVALGYAVAREVDAGAKGPGELLAWLLTGQVWVTLSALAVAGVGSWVAFAGGRIREGPWFALGLAATCLAIFAGLADAAVLARSVAPVPFAPVWARLAVATVLAAGAGVVVAATVTLRRGSAARLG